MTISKSALDEIALSREEYPLILERLGREPSMGLEGFPLPLTPSRQGREAPLSLDGRGQGEGGFRSFS